MPAGARTDLSGVHGLKLQKGRLPHLFQQGRYGFPDSLMLFTQRVINVVKFLSNGETFSLFPSLVWHVSILSMH